MTASSAVLSFSKLGRWWTRPSPSFGVSRNPYLLAQAIGAAAVLKQVLCEAFVHAQTVELGLPLLQIRVESFMAAVPFMLVAAFAPHFVVDAAQSLRPSSVAPSLRAVERLQ